MSSDVLVVIGVGGMGRAIARRLGAGKAVILADFNESTLHASATALSDDGYDVHAHTVDVASAASVANLIHAAQLRGPVRQLAHTAGLSPSQATTEKILAVDLLGVAQIVDAFGEEISTGGAGVVIASMAGHMVPPLPAEHAHALATASPKDLLTLPFITAIDNPGSAYVIAKQANLLRVQAASRMWGKRNARINSISPGIISTPMGRSELASPLGEGMRAMVTASPAKRLGTPEDIAAAATYLLGPEASFITGTDLLVDGGVVAAT
ncbi:MAG TPA: SDR family oxidoreductase [Mycobacterium sp.]|nr:SDR family oxidoreductase [Mycobacterium sp.]